MGDAGSPSPHGSDHEDGDQGGGEGDSDSGAASNDESTPDPDAASGAPTETKAGSRDVVVPLRLYKTVTVFSTLFAVAFVLAGFVLLDVATDRATADVSEIDPVLAILGLAGIVGGAAVYAFSTRFRTEGMGKSKDESDEPPNDG